MRVKQLPCSWPSAEKQKSSCWHSTSQDREENNVIRGVIRQFARSDSQMQHAFEDSARLLAVEENDTSLPLPHLPQIAESRRARLADASWDDFNPMRLSEDEPDVFIAPLEDVTSQLKLEEEWRRTTRLLHEQFDRLIYDQLNERPGTGADDADDFEDVAPLFDTEQTVDFGFAEFTAPSPSLLEPHSLIEVIPIEDALPDNDLHDVARQQQPQVAQIEEEEVYALVDQSEEHDAQFERSLTTYLPVELPSQPVTHQQQPQQLEQQQQNFEIEYTPIVRYYVRRGLCDKAEEEEEVEEEEEEEKNVQSVEDVNTTVDNEDSVAGDVDVVAKSNFDGEEENDVDNVEEVGEDEEAEEEDLGDDDKTGDYEVKDDEDYDEDYDTELDDDDFQPVTKRQKGVKRKRSPGSGKIGRPPGSAAKSKKRRVDDSEQHTGLLAPGYCHNCKKRRDSCLACPILRTHRYCENCLVRHFATTYDDILSKRASPWQNGCPICHNNCPCAACKRKKDETEPDLPPVKAVSKPKKKLKAVMYNEGSEDGIEPEPKLKKKAKTPRKKRSDKPTKSAKSNATISPRKAIAKSSTTHSPRRATAKATTSSPRKATMKTTTISPQKATSKLVPISAKPVAIKNAEPASTYSTINSKLKEARPRIWTPINILSERVSQQQQGIGMREYLVLWKDRWLLEHELAQVTASGELKVKLRERKRQSGEMEYLVKRRKTWIVSAYLPKKMVQAWDILQQHKAKEKANRKRAKQELACVTEPLSDPIDSEEEEVTAGAVARPRYPAPQQQMQRPVEKKGTTAVKRELNPLLAKMSVDGLMPWESALLGCKDPLA